MAKFAEITAAMHIYNNTVAYGSECNAWQDFVQDCYSTVGHAPGAEWQDEDGEFHAAADLDVSDDFAKYWLAVADGSSTDYVGESGSKVDA